MANAKNDAKKGNAVAPKTKTVSLRIVSIDTRTNKNGKTVIKTVEGDEINPSGTFQFTEKHLDNFAAQLRATNGDVLANAIADSFDDNVLALEAVYVKAGDKVLNDKGEEIIDVETDEAMVYTTPHWKITKQEIILGDDATSYIASLNKQIDLQEIAASRASKRRTRNVPTPSPVNKEIIVDEDLD